MTRLSDSLRGLADRAPVDDVSVSTSGATRRIHRGRRLRAAANATAGVGVAAVIALAAINPGVGSGTSSADAAAMPGAPEGVKVGAPGFDASGASQLAWGQCGTRPFDADVPASSGEFSLTLGDIGADVEPGATVTAALTVTRSADAAGAYTTTGPIVIVLWDGNVVGTAQNSTLDPDVQSAEDGNGTWAAPFVLVNCWDGTALPPGAYELVAYQDFFSDSGQIVPSTEPAPAPAEPTLAPAEPTLSPADPATATDAPIAVDGGVGTGSGVVAPGATSSDGGPVAGNTGVVGPPAVDAPARAVSNTVKFVVAGDVPEDPFGAYLSPAVPAVVYPDDYLTPAAARDEYAARAAASTWDMAAGTQRVVKSGDSTAVSDQNAWLDSYYGCSADGTTTPSFPATSADWPLLKVDATLPGSVGVSYGWVIDGNPEVKVSVTNISGHTLPGFWGQPSTSMYLVKDGKVVATSYLTSTDPNGYTTSTSTDGLLAPDGTLSGTYLWRDVNGCWIGDAQATITRGTYTVLIEQDVYLDSGNGGGGPVMYQDGAKGSVEGGGVGVASSGGTVARGTVSGGTVSGGDNPVAGTAQAPAIAGGSVVAPAGTTADTPTMVAPIPVPVDGTYDWLSLQVWTSLGQVTVK